MLNDLFVGALSDQIETEFGTAILEELTGESLTSARQRVRLFDETNHTAEYYFPDNGQGKPYIHDFQQGKRWYPINAYKEANNLDWQTALRQLSLRYLGDTQLKGKRGILRPRRPSLIALPPPPSYHDPTYVASTLGHYERNDFAIYLRRLLGTPKANELLRLFQVGTGREWHIAPYWPRSTIFWQIDERMSVRAGKIMHYSPATGKRLQDAFLQPNWVHKLERLNDFHHEQCLFGLQQLSQQSTTKPVAIVESEKTAIIATAFEPGYIWLASGGLGNLSANKCRVLAGRDLTLFPDLKGFEKWSNKANELRRVGCLVSVSHMLENQATVLQRVNGSDLADFLTEKRCPDTGRVLTQEGHPIIWNCEPTGARTT